MHMHLGNNQIKQKECEEKNGCCWDESKVIHLYRLEALIDMASTIHCFKTDLHLSMMCTQHAYFNAFFILFHSQMLPGAFFQHLRKFAIQINQEKIVVM